MKKVLMAGAMLALMTGMAAAQTADPNTPPLPATQNDAGSDGGMQADGPGGGDPGPDGFGGPPGAGDRGGWGHRGWRHGAADGMGGPDGMHGPHGWRHGPGMMPPRSRGAVFRFVRGHDRGAIVIRCAEEDTTRECAEAVMPLLKALMPNRGMPDGDGTGGQAAPAPAQ